MTVRVNTYRDIAWNQKEILRYAGCPKDGEAPLLDSALAEAGNVFTYSVCFCTSRVRPTPGGVAFEFAEVASEGLRQSLAGCDRALLFAATVGIGIDRLIERYSRVSPARALMFQAIGSERIESLCDRFCAERNEQLAQNGQRLKPRFSPGYGDLPLSFQKEMFSVLDCGRKIGLTLNESLLMSPSKSVTAIAGIAPAEDIRQTKSCAVCGLADCAFRSGKDE